MAYWAPHSIACFAGYSTKQVGRYCLRWWNPGYATVDGFPLPWKEQNASLFSPIHLISDMLQKGKKKQNYAMAF